MDKDSACTPLEVRSESEEMCSQKVFTEGIEIIQLWIKTGFLRILFEKYGGMMGSTPCYSRKIYHGKI